MELSPLLQSRIEQQERSKQGQNSIVRYADLTQKPDTFESGSQKEEINNNEKTKLTKIVLAAAAISAISATAAYSLKKGRVINLENMTSEKFRQIKTDKFTGKIKGELKNGDNIIMEYVNGILKKSTRSGKVNYEKAYETINDEKIVKKTTDGITSEFNITKIRAQAMQKVIKKVLNNTERQLDSQIIELSSILEKQITLDMKPLKMVETAQEQMDLYKSKFENFKKEFTKLDEQGVPVSADEEIIATWYNIKNKLEYEIDTLDRIIKQQGCFLDILKEYGTGNIIPKRFFQLSHDYIINYGFSRISDKPLGICGEVAECHQKLLASIQKTMKLNK